MKSGHRKMILRRIRYLREQLEGADPNRDDYYYTRSELSALVAALVEIAIRTAGGRMY